MPTTHNIQIVDSDLSTGLLTFRPHRALHTRAGSGDTIRWHIQTGSGVDAIDSIKEKTETDNIWSQLPSKKNGYWEGVIKDEAEDFEFYVYLITWRRGSQTRTHDPLISIKPSHLDDILKFILRSLPWIAIGGLATLLYGKKRRT